MKRYHPKRREVVYIANLGTGGSDVIELDVPKPGIASFYRNWSDFMCLFRPTSSQIRKINRVERAKKRRGVAVERIRIFNDQIIPWWEEIK